MNVEHNIEFTTTISPKVPGNNHFMVVANSRKEGVEIKSIELFLKYKDNPDVAPIQVPFSDTGAVQDCSIHDRRSISTIFRKLDSRDSNIRFGG